MSKYTIEQIARFSKSKSGAPFKGGCQKVNMKLLGLDDWVSFFDEGDKMFLKEADIIEGEVVTSKDGKFKNFEFDGDKAGYPRVAPQPQAPAQPTITRDEFLNLISTIEKLDKSMTALINHLKISTDGLPF